VVADGLHQGAPPMSSLSQNLTKNDIISCVKTSDTNMYKILHETSTRIPRQDVVFFENKVIQQGHVHAV
jgi:hypothetical protein